MDLTRSDSDFAAHVLEACVQHGRLMLLSQLPDVEGRNYDFMPSFREMTTQLYLVGVMWRFGEQFELPTNARDRGFICLMSMLVSDGMTSKDAQRHIANLNQISRTADGQDSLAITAGYGASEADGTLANLFDHFRNEPKVSGAPYRLLDRSKAIAAILALAGVVISVVLGRSWGEALGVGVVFGVSTLAIALAMYRQMTKVNRKSA